MSGVKGYAEKVACKEPPPGWLDRLHGVDVGAIALAILDQGSGSVRRLDLFG
jgi:hypothetical protein